MPGSPRPQNTPVWPAMAGGRGGGLASAGRRRNERNKEQTRGWKQLKAHQYEGAAGECGGRGARDGEARQSTNGKPQKGAPGPSARLWDRRHGPRQTLHPPTAGHLRGTCSPYGTFRASGQVRVSAHTSESATTKTPAVHTRCLDRLHNRSDRRASTRTTTCKRASPACDRTTQPHAKTPRTIWRTT